jgi:hypothetical protein
MTIINPAPKRNAPSKVCPECYAVAYAARRQCFECGHIFIKRDHAAERAAYRALVEALEVKP